MSVLDELENNSKRTVCLQNTLIARATGGNPNNRDYVALR